MRVRVKNKILCEKNTFHFSSGIFLFFLKAEPFTNEEILSLALFLELLVDEVGDKVAVAVVTFVAAILLLLEPRRVKERLLLELLATETIDAVSVTVNEVEDVDDSRLRTDSVITTLLL